MNILTPVFLTNREKYTFAPSEFKFLSSTELRSAELPHNLIITRTLKPIGRVFSSPES